MTPRTQMINDLEYTLIARERNKVLFTPYALLTEKKFGYFPTNLDNCPSVTLHRKECKVTKIFFGKNKAIMIESHVDGKHYLDPISALSDTDVEKIVTEAEKIHRKNTYYKDIPIDWMEYHSEPTHYECVRGYGCTHYKDFQTEYIYKDDGLFKRRVKDEDGRIWTR